MSPLTLRRRPAEAKSDLAELENEPQAHDAPPIATATEQVTTEWSTRAVSAGLLLCLALGPVGAGVGVYALVQSSTGTQPTAAAAADLSEDRARAGEYAQRVVLTWLTTTRDDTSELEAMVKGVQLTSIAEVAFTVRDATVAGIRFTDDVWTVTVAATVTDAREETARRFFQVPVVLSDDTVTALTLPTPVAGASIIAGTSPEYRTRVDTTSPIGQTVVEFLSAYLAQAGDVARYVTPGVELTALTPAPYTAVTLTDLRALGAVDVAESPADGQQLRVLATGSAVVTEDQSSPVTYALTLTARAGRWEITAIDAAPAISTPDATTATDAVPTTGGTTPDPSTTP